MPAASTVNRAERALVAGAVQWAVGLASGLAHGGPVRETADEGTGEAMRLAALVHVGVVLAAAGAATVVALRFFVLPPALFVAVCAALTAVLVVLGVRSLRRLRLVAGRGWLFWAGIAWGLLVASGAYLTQLTGFVPHLLLAWMLGMLVLGVFGAGAVQTAVAGVLAALWVGAAALVGESLLPGLVILVVLFAFPVLARPSRLVGAAAAVLALALAVAAALRMLANPPAVPLAVVTAVATGGVLRAVATRFPLDARTGAPPRGCPGYGIAALTTAFGVVALATVGLPPVLDRLRVPVLHAGTGGRAGLLLPLGVLVLAAAVPGRLRAGAWRVLGAWVLGCAALVLALILAAPVPTVVVAAVAATVAGYGLWRSGPAAPIPGRWRRIAAGLGWLLLAVLLASAGRPWYVGAGLTIALGVYVIVLAIRMRRAEQQAPAVPFGTGPPPPDDAVPPGEPAEQAAAP